MIEEFNRLKKEAKERMDKSIDHLKQEFKKLKTGRASISMIEDMHFLYYNNPTLIKSVASLSTPDPHTIVIDPWDKGALHAIEKGISEAGLGFTTNNDGKIIRVNIPALTEDRKKELVKYAKELAEETRVIIRNARRDINQKVKDMVKDGHIGEDDEHKELDDIQKVTDNHIKNIDTSLANKEKDIMDI